MKCEHKNKKVKEHETEENYPFSVLFEVCKDCGEVTEFISIALRGDIFHESITINADELGMPRDLRYIRKSFDKEGEESKHL